MLSRQLGWPIDFMHDDQSVSFVLVVPSSPFAGSDAIQASATTPIAAPKESVAHPPLRKPPSITYDQMHNDVAVVAEQE